MTTTNAIYVGIDVAKRYLDIASRPGSGPWRTTNDAEGIADLLQRLAAASPTLVVLEASGGWERAAALALQQAGVPVAIVNPRQARDFAKATGRLAKTDALDAQMLAHYAEAVQPQPRPQPEASRRHLQALVGRRQQLVEMRTAERTRRPTLPAELHAALDAHLTWLDEHITALEQELAQAVDARADWKAEVARLQTVPGIGFLSAVTLLAELPELGQRSAKELAMLTGLAPLNRDSGRLRGQRHIWGGRATVRRPLYLAALVGIRHNTILKASYTKLRTAGKPPKVALIACAHKLLTILNAMTKQQTDWREPAPKEEATPEPTA